MKFAYVKFAYVSTPSLSYAKRRIHVQIFDSTAVRAKPSTGLESYRPSAELAGLIRRLTQKNQLLLRTINQFQTAYHQCVSAGRPQPLRPGRTEIASFLELHAEKWTEDGHRRLVRHGHLPEVRSRPASATSARVNRVFRD